MNLLFTQNTPEIELYQKGVSVIVGLDEVGRGCLAGPVVTAACILPKSFDLPGLNDSKKVSPKKRETLYELICQQALAYSFGQIEAEEIDHINIHQATLKAFTIALQKLSLAPDYILVDGIHKVKTDLPQLTIKQGDSKSPSIAAASILAKVKRDRMMVELESSYPQYGFAKHKGYGTKIHLEALKIHGPTSLHRKSFRGVL